MTKRMRLATAVAVGTVLLLGGCATAANDTHRHGPRGQPMQDSAMPAANEQRPQDQGMHNMPGPRGGPMLDAAHPRCPPESTPSAPATEEPQRDPQ